MKSYDVILEEVRAIVVEVLACEPDEVQPSSRFFEDLGGESIDMLELTFRCEKLYGIKMPLQQLGMAGELAADENGRLTPESLVSMKAKYPSLDYSGFEHDPVQTRITELITVAAIARFVVEALATGESAESSCPIQGDTGGLGPLSVGG